MSTLDAGKTDYERGRQAGIRQACQFLITEHDEPTLAKELKEYVLPHPHWRKVQYKRRLKKGIY